MIITSAVLNAARLGFQASLNKGFQKADARTWWKDVAMTTTSDTESEIYPMLAEIPDFREWTGDRVVNNLVEKGYQLFNKDYELTIGVPRNKFLDNKIGTYAPLFESLGERKARLPELLVIRAMEAGETTVGLDGQYQYDGDHPVDAKDASKGTQSNYEASGFALNATNFATAYDRMCGFKAEDNRSVRAVPTVLHVPQALRAMGESIVDSPLLSSGATNPNYKRCRLVVEPDFSDATAWYLHATDRPVKPYIFQLRQEALFESLNKPTDANVFNDKTFLFGGDGRMVVGYGIWQFSFKGRA